MILVTRNDFCLYKNLRRALKFRMFMADKLQDRVLMGIVAPKGAVPIDLSYFFCLFCLFCLYRLTLRSTIPIVSFVFFRILATLVFLINIPLFRRYENASGDSLRQQSFNTSSSHHKKFYTLIRNLVTPTFQGLVLVLIRKGTTP